MRELVTVEPTGDSVVRTLSSYGATSNISLTLDAGGEEALSGEDGLAFVSTDSGTTIIDTASGGTAGSTTGYVRAVLENNDLLVEETGLLVRKTLAGTVVGTIDASAFQEARHVSGGLWVAASFSGVAGQLGIQAPRANSPFPQSRGVGRTAAARTPTVLNFHTSPVVAKYDECVLKFRDVDPSPGPGQPGRFYRAIDGVLPPAWGGDWLKVNNGVRVNIESHGEPTAYGGGLRTCWSDDPNSTFYTSCGGRKDEPQWSKPVSEGGKGMVDWKYPRPEPFDCGPPPPWWKFW